jgi:hypothetical protein
VSILIIFDYDCYSSRELVAAVVMMSDEKRRMKTDKFTYPPYIHTYEDATGGTRRREVRCEVHADLHFSLRA